MWWRSERRFRSEIYSTSATRSAHEQAIVDDLYYDTQAERLAAEQAGEAQ
jgi:hypothetical protein